MKEIEKALADAQEFHSRVMKEANHAKSCWSAETIGMMNLLPGQIQRGTNELRKITEAEDQFVYRYTDDDDQTWWSDNPEDLCDNFGIDESDLERFNLGEQINDL